jgi:hypothetical protein
VTGSSAVVDLRQDTLVPGQRDTLIDLFDRYLAEGQEAVGIKMIGQFRDVDDPDRFVWLRGFESMADRGTALRGFYSGPVWREHSAAASATMLDSDNALLLEPLRSVPANWHQNARADVVPATTLIAITVAHLSGPITEADRDLARTAGTALAEAGAEMVAVLTTQEAANNFPELPLRDEHVLVWVTRFSDDDHHTRHCERVAKSAAWRDTLHHLAPRSTQLPRIQHLRLRPTDGSHLR